MLRITLEKGPEFVTLKLEGELSGLWVDELRRLWNDVRNGEMARSLAVDLSDVTFVNSEGQALLKRMFRDGADLRSGPCVSVTRFILDRIKHEWNEKQSMRMMEDNDAFALRLGIEQKL
jgi:ABC-type transporter Mla MlaB component